MGNKGQRRTLEEGVSERLGKDGKMERNIMVVEKLKLEKEV